MKAKSKTKKLDIERIKQLFLLLTNLPDSELPRWEEACKRGARHIEGRLREDADTSAHGEELCAAAAGCAYYEYVLLELRGAVIGGEIRVGGISVKNTAGARADAVREAEATRDYYISCCAGLLRSKPSVFFSIREEKEEADAV